MAYRGERVLIPAAEGSRCPNYLAPGGARAVVAGVVLGECPSGKVSVLVGGDGGSVKVKVEPHSVLPSPRVHGTDAPVWNGVETEPAAAAAAAVASPPPPPALLPRDAGIPCSIVPSILEAAMATPPPPPPPQADGCRVFTPSRGPKLWDVSPSPQPPPPPPLLSEQQRHHDAAIGMLQHAAYERDLYKQQLEQVCRGVQAQQRRADSLRVARAGTAVNRLTPAPPGSEPTPPPPPAAAVATAAAPTPTPTPPPSRAVTTTTTVSVHRSPAVAAAAAAADPRLLQRLEALGGKVGSLRLQLLQQQSHSPAALSPPALPPPPPSPTSPRGEHDKTQPVSPAGLSAEGSAPPAVRPQSSLASTSLPDMTFESSNR